MQRDLLDPQRERRIETPFGFIPFRLLTDGHVHQMSLAELALYFFLSLAADRRGLSFCSDGHLQHVLPLTDKDIHRARRGLRDKGLLAFACERHVVTYQLLALPTPKAIPAMREQRSPARTDRRAPETTTAPQVSNVHPVSWPPHTPSFDVTPVRNVLALLKGTMSGAESNSAPKKNP